MWIVRCVVGGDLCGLWLESVAGLRPPCCRASREREREGGLATVQANTQPFVLDLRRVSSTTDNTI